MADTDRLFTRELPGEAGPTVEQMSLLVLLADAVQKAAPWDRGLGDREVIAVDPRGGGERLYCVFMGTLGEIFGLQAYVGDAGYAEYEYLVSGDEEPAAADYLGRLRAVSVEFVEKEELAKADRTALKPARLKARARQPKFRSWRPGYHPWYLNEGEAELLTDCLEAVLTFVSELDSSPVAWWTEPKTFPLMRFRDGAWHSEMASAPPPPSGPERVEPDSRWVESVRHLPKAGTLEVAHRFANAGIGEADERKAMLRVGLAVDGETGKLFAPEVATPEEETGDILNRALLGAITARNTIPARVNVKDGVEAELLRPLASALGFEIKHAPSTPAVDDVFAAMVRYLQER